MERDACLQSLPLYIFSVSSIGALPPVSPCRAPTDASFPEPTFMCLRVPSKQAPSRFPNGAPMERDAHFQSLLLHTSRSPQKTRSSDKTKSHLSLLPVKEPPSTFPQWGPYRERCSVSGANGLFIHLYLSESSVKELFHKIGGHVQSLSMEPHMDGRPTYYGVQPGSSRGWIMTLLFLPQCHAAFSNIASTLAWVDQIPISQRVL